LRRSQAGNNNAYCQDNCTSWLDWGLEQANPDMLRFFRLLIAFRKRHSCLRPRSFEQGPKVEWHGVHIGAPDWSEQSRSIAMHLHGKVATGEEADQIYVIANAFWEPLTFELPSLLGREWYLFVDTMREPPLDILAFDHEERLRDQKSYGLGPRSVVVLIAK
jgi:isoamylase